MRPQTCSVALWDRSTCLCCDYPLRFAIPSFRSAVKYLRGGVDVVLDGHFYHVIRVVLAEFKLYLVSNRASLTSPGCTAKTCVCFLGYCLVLFF